MINKMLLQSGKDIPFAKAGLTIHQPRLHEIAMVGGQSLFFAGCSVLNFKKESLPSEDKINLDKQTNFDIFMSIIKDKREEVKYTQLCVIMVLQILFKDYEIFFDEKNIIFIKEDEDGNKIERYINAVTFNDFQAILQEMLNLSSPEDELNHTGGALSKRIEEKLKERKKKLAELKKNESDSDEDVFTRYISILSVGLNKTYEELYEYTVYQIFEEFQRYIAKVNYDTYFSAKVAGATGMDEVENWMNSLDSINKNK